MKMRLSHRALSLFLALCLSVSLCSAALAAEESNEPIAVLAPAEESAPAEEPAPAEQPTSAEGSVPVEEPASDNEPVPAEETDPAEAPAPEAALDTGEEEAMLDGAPGGGGGAPGGGGGAPGGGGSSGSVSWQGATEITAAAAAGNQTYSSTKAGQNALLINTSQNVTLTNPTVTKSGGTSAGDSESFYGTNAAVMVKGGTKTTVTGGTVTTSAAGANGVFSYGGNGGRNGAAGDGTTVNIYDTVITTTGGGSGGIMTTGGGITNAYNLTVTTSGQSSAPIRTDRGGGTVYVDSGTYTSNGLGSPAIYSTASVTVENATLVSNLSEGVCIEGKNSITLVNCDLTANNTRRNGNAQFLDSIMIYQSMSGDAASGTARFTMTGGSLTSRSGHVFHVTNTNAVITLSGVDIRNQDSAGILLSVCDDGWSGGSNIATLLADGQTLEGGVLVGSDSRLTMTLSDASSFRGYVSGRITNYAGSSVSASVGTVAVTLDATSTWTLTQDSYITSFRGDLASIDFNGHILYVNGTPITGTGWVSYGGNWYYYLDSVLMKGWLPLETGVYYLDPATGAVQTGWQLIDGSYYYFMPSTARMATGVQRIFGSYYLFDEDGTVHLGWLEYGSAKYYYDPDTGKLVTGWQLIDGSYYYFMPSTAQMATGVQKISGYYYLFDEDGTVHLGWLDYDDAKYYYDPDNARLVTGWKEIDGGWYYFSTKTARMVTGWVYYGGYYFYTDPEDGGRMVIGKTIEIDGRSYTFNSNGVCTG